MTKRSELDIDEPSLYMDCNGKLWYFKKYSDTEHKDNTKTSLFEHPNLYKLKRHLIDIITERNMDIINERNQLNRD